MRLLHEIKSDLARFDQPGWRTLMAEPQHRWLLLYRIADASHGLLRVAAAQVVKWRGGRLGFSVPLGTLGPSLRLAHRGTITINGAARVGRNCQIYQGVTLGGAVTIGDDVFIGPHATIIGDGVRIGDRVRVMGGANIRSDVPAGAVRGPIDDGIDRRVVTR